MALITGCTAGYPPSLCDAPPSPSCPPPPPLVFATWPGISALFIHQSAGAKPISKFSKFPDEAEVLFRPNTVFEITSTLYGTSDIGQFYSEIDNIAMSEMARKEELPEGRAPASASHPLHKDSVSPDLATINVTISAEAFYPTLTMLVNSSMDPVDTLEVHDDPWTGQWDAGPTAVAGACLTGGPQVLTLPPPPPREKRERIIVVVRSPCQENDPADAHPSAHKSVLESANPRMYSEGVSGFTGSTARATARLRDGRPPE